MATQLRIFALLCMAALLGACASSNSGDTYTRGQTRQTQTVKMGTVESVRPVKIEGTGTPVGTGAGAIIGGVAGGSMGGGRGSIITSVLGAVVGGMAGAAVEEGVTRENGIEITVQMDRGDTLAIVQEAGEQFQPGDRVRVLQSGNVSRVTH